MTASNTEIRSFQARCRGFAKSRGYTDSADDFAQDAVIRWLSSGYQNLDNLLTDFLRKEFGSLRKNADETYISEKSALKSAARYSTRSLDEPSLESARRLRDIIPSETSEIQENSLKIRLLNAELNSRGEFISRLTLEEGLKQEDIGEILGISASRVSQIQKKSRVKASSVSILIDSYDIYTDDKEYSKLAIDWITV